MIRRVRTGCITCRRRRIKCDEAKPTCDRCHNANFHCEGYDAPRRTDSSAPSFAPKSASSSPRNDSSSPDSMVSELPWRQPNWRKEQLSSYHHFVTSTVVRLFRADHINFWRDHVAQMSFGIDSVYEALLAVGAAHRASLLSRSRRNLSEVSRCKVLGFSAYGKALNLLADSMGQDTTTDPWPVLIVLLLCTYFECFMENSKGALQHLWAAIQLFKTLEADSSGPDLENLVPVYEVLLRLDFLALKLLPYSASSFTRCSDLAMMELPFWNRQPGKFSSIAQSDAIATERHRLMQLVCGHNKLSRVIWGCWYPTSERPSRAELMGFYNEMLLWKATSPATFMSYPVAHYASSLAEFAKLPMPPEPLKFISSEAAINAIMFNGYMGCTLAMISTTDEDPISREMEAFNLAYENICISAGLIHEDNERSSNNYMACDTLDMGISVFLYHGVRRCFSVEWQQWCLSALRVIGREGLSNAHALANTLEIMSLMEPNLPQNQWIDGSVHLEKSPLGSIRDRLIPLLMPPVNNNEFLAYFLRYGITEEYSDERHIRIVGRATWQQDDSGVIQSIEVNTYDSSDKRANALPDESGNMTIFASWRQSVEQGWHGFLSADEIAVQDSEFSDRNHNIIPKVEIV